MKVLLFLVTIFLFQSFALEQDISIESSIEDDEEATCPNVLPASLSQSLFTIQASNASNLTFTLCGTLPNGCFQGNSGNCKTAGCCSICLTWSLPTPGAACLGKFNSAVWNANLRVVTLNYTGGDPVGEPVPGPREAVISVACASSYPTLGNLTFINPSTPRDDGTYVAEISGASSTLCPSNSGPTPLGGGVIFLIVLVVLIVVGGLAAFFYFRIGRRGYQSAN